MAANLSLQKGFELAGNHLLAEWRETISEYTTFEVIKLMLDNSSKIAINPLLMLNEVLVIPLYVDALCTCHTLMNTWQRETSLFQGLRLRVIILKDVTIDECVTIVFILREGV